VKSSKGKVMLDISSEGFANAIADAFKVFAIDYILILIRARGIVKVLKKLFLIKKLRRSGVFNCCRRLYPCAILVG
jgi:hypothetical protein